MNAPVLSFTPTAVDHSAVVALQVSASSAASLTPSEVAALDVDHYAVFGSVPVSPPSLLFSLLLFLGSL